MKRPSGSALGLVNLLLLVWVVMLAEPAFAEHRACRESRGSSNDFWIDAQIGPVNIASGIGGRLEIRQVHLEAFGGSKVESFYLIQDADNWVEFGWYVDRDNTQTGPKTIFHARRYAGDYFDWSAEDGDHLIGGQYLAMFYDSSQRRFKFTRNSSPYSGLGQGVRPRFSDGVPQPQSEIHNECDEGQGRFWTLDYRNRSGVWGDAEGNSRLCDRMTHHGYAYVTSDEFKVVERLDHYVSPLTCAG